MQERDFIPKVGTNSEEFWEEVNRQAKDHDADNILMYMQLMLRRADQSGEDVRKRSFSELGKKLDLFSGVEDWFPRINKYCKDTGILPKHFIVSSGLKEMIDGTKIKKYFEKIYASNFYYNHHGIAVWPALALNYTTKTQYLFRINKGVLDIHDNSVINEYIPHDKREVPFKHMIFIGDGETDIPCFRLVKEQGGHSIAVYQSNKRGARKRATKLFEDQRVNFIASADFQIGSGLDRIVKAILDKVHLDDYLYGLSPK